jgi:hypothetical protein
MKTLTLPHVATLTLALGLAGLGRAAADDATLAPAEGHHWHHDSVLTADEHAELKKDREQVFASNPDLKAEDESLHSQWKSEKDASADDKKAFHEKMKAFHDKLDTAIEAIDPAATALIDKERAAHHHHDGASNT